MNNILTPDQKLRVFVSSTLEELKDEREAAQRAINNLRLIPVLFEISARNHPPQELYKAYLNQSQIFLGIYGEKYGWIGPEMTISGLEEEYRLSQHLPKLIYIKNVEKRDERLQLLIQEWQTNGKISYKKFNSAGELEELIQNDLSIILSETFGNFNKNRPKSRIPKLPYSIIGREKEIRELKILIRKEKVSVISLTGTGGTGKTSLAIELANSQENNFSDGVHFISFAAVNDPDLFIPVINDYFGIFDNAKVPQKESLLNFLRDKNILIVLDNLEQMINSGEKLSEIVMECMKLKFLITSRTPLDIRYETVYPVEPLQAPSIEELEMINKIKVYPAVKMFVSRTKEANSKILMNNENLITIGKICNKLDGLPLAIELAAYRTKSLNLSALLKNLDNSLDFLSKGQRDLPARQKTIRATIDWSYNLLDSNAQEFFQRLSIFEGSFTFEAIESVCGQYAESHLDLIEKSTDSGLVQRKIDTKCTRYFLLKIVREYALEKLICSNDYDKIAENFIKYYLQLLDKIEPELWKVNYKEFIEELDRERLNFSFAFNLCIKSQNYIAAWKIIGNLAQYWQVRGYITIALEWLNIAKIKYLPKDINHMELLKNIPKEVAAKALACASVIRFYSGEEMQSYKDAEQSLHLFKKTNNELFICRVLGFKALIGLAIGKMENIWNLYRGYNLAYKNNDLYSIIALTAILSEISLAFHNTSRSEILINRAFRTVKGEFETITDLYEENAFKYLKMIETNFLITKGEYNKAEESISLSIDNDQSKTRSVYTVWAPLVQAYVKIFLNKFEEAEISFKQSYEISETLGDLHMQINSLQVLSALQLNKNNVENSIILFYGALKLFNKNKFANWSSTNKFNRCLEKQIINSAEPNQIDEIKSNMPEYSVKELFGLPERGNIIEKINTSRLSLMKKINYKES